MTPITEKRLLQAAIALGGAFSLIVAVLSVTQGVHILTPGEIPTNINLDSHFRYLSGIFLGVLVGIYSCVPRIEHRAARFRLLGACIVCGGLARLGGAVLLGLPPADGHRYGLVMELVVTPLLLLWQARVARRFAQAPA